MKGASIKGCSLKGCSLDISNEKLDIVKEYVKMVARGNINCLFLFGEGGIGKTETILRTLENEECKSVYMNGVVTPLELYHSLFDYNGKLIIYDDIEGVLSSSKAVSLLKGATYGYKGKRVLNYNTTSSLLRVPENFEFTGRIILCMNHFPENNPSLEALYRRTLYYELRLSLQEKMDIFKQIAERSYPGISKEKRIMIYDFIIEHVSEATKRLSIREIFKAFEIYKATNSKWRALVRELLQVDTDTEVFLKTEKMRCKINHRIKTFSEVTGKSRATYFRIKRKLLGD